jgi:hypothetical protein
MSRIRRMFLRLTLRLTRKMMRLTRLSPTQKQLEIQRGMDALPKLGTGVLGSLTTPTNGNT